MSCDRYKRQTAVIGSEGQKKINDAAILIVGLGGIGSPVAQYLAASGVGRLVLVDDDKVELTNLHRQILFNESDIGCYKTETALNVLSKINNKMGIEIHTKKFDRDFDFSLISDVDLVIDGTDNFETRYLINDVCVLRNKVFISCSILVHIIQLILFNPNECCYRCLYPNPPPVGVVPNCSEAGVLGTVTGMAGTMAANLAINFILKTEDTHSSQVRIIDAKNLSLSTFSIKKNKECVSCQQRKINLEELKGQAKDYGLSFKQLDRNKHFLVDIRQKEERELVKLDDDLFFPIKDNLDYDFFLSYKQKQLVFYCASGYRSKLFASELRDLGVDAYYLNERLSK
ncbi:HesA/MoeB/ThiF family protein [Legionella sp. km772]|uniref:HesA/MoeB/ThiF family protein n=1 Tax=Legionella sp. km772 TaxID=2498111 RepID=UPI000F8DCA80|nr:HesA/MoeB/ThiF family protein [Legionella sp. km772]RUR14106.1 thiamine biosynthesis protein ThiF [Legionella sp. km772]